MKRIVGRYSCKECGKIYNKFFAKPKNDSVCDDCGNEGFVSRADDNEQTIASRLQAYDESTAPLIDYYSKKKALYSVDAAQDKEVVEYQLKDILKNI